MFLIRRFVLRRRFRVFVFSPGDEKPRDVRESLTGSVFNRRLFLLFCERVNAVGVLQSKEEVLESEK